jgi:hypothetical protein
LPFAESLIIALAYLCIYGAQTQDAIIQKFWAIDRQPRAQFSFFVALEKESPGDFISAEAD